MKIKMLSTIDPTLLRAISIAVVVPATAEIPEVERVVLLNYLFLVLAELLGKSVGRVSVVYWKWCERECRCGKKWLWLWLWL